MSLDKTDAALLRVFYTAAVAVVLILFAAAWLGRARAAASVECAKAGGDWVDNECTRKP